MASIGDEVFVHSSLVDISNKDSTMSIRTLWQVWSATYRVLIKCTPAVREGRSDTVIPVREEALQSQYEALIALAIDLRNRSGLEALN